ncbi:MAG TPA: glycosyltransferase [Saprospiraceae bacterium]|nr:glycosyltransferase [Saprospiraceae bacterium]
MKVIITVTTDIQFDQRVRKIASSLTNAGHDVLVIGRYKAAFEPKPDSFKKQWISCWFKRSACFYAEFNIRLFLILMFKSFDRLYACDLDTLLGAGLAAKIKIKKLIFDAHEYMEESVELRKKKWISSIWSFIGRLSIPWTDVRLTVSDSLANELASKYKLNFLVLRNVPYIQKTQPDVLHKKIIWYQGAINEGRGLELVLDCLIDLPEYQFHLAGTGDILELLKMRSLQLGLEGRVQFYGRLSYEEMLRHASMAFVGIDLLESDSKSYWFSLSNKTFDYMQAQLPIIQMNFPEYKKIHNQFNTGVLLESFTDIDFINAIRQLEDHDYYLKCKHNSKSASEFYNWEKEQKILLAVFD